MRSVNSMPRIRHLAFGLPRFASMFVYTSLVTLTLPVWILQEVGDQVKGVHLGMITAAAALLSVGMLVFFGWYRDRESRIIQGPKYPLYALGIMLPGLILLHTELAYVPGVVIFLVLIVARSFCEASHLAVLADQPQLGGTERYTAGIAFWHFLGTGLGAAAFGLVAAKAWFGPAGSAANPAFLSFFVVLLTMVAYHQLVVRKSIVDPEPRRLRPERVPVRLPRNLLLLIAARVLFLSGLLIISTFLVFIVRDLLGAENVRRTTALLYGGAIFGSVLAALPAGRLTERCNERYVLFLAGGIQALTAVLFFTLGRFHLVITLLCMLAYGAGFSLVISAGLSLTVKFIPHPRMSGRIMAVITASTFLAQFVASASGAMVLDPLNRLSPNLGYFALLVLLELYMLAGGVFLYFIKEHRK
ncbi:MAG TPA: MFS transporter [Deltaproteobacteria bacterium]|nr:MFS transporter [Deltaproteobacteria bacterium]